MIKFSNSYEAKKKRIARLPKMAEDAMMAHMKWNATQLILEFQDGIRKNNFGLEKMKQASITSKMRKTYKMPATPLYGLGDRSDKSYINMMRIKKIKHGYKVYPSWAKHHDSNLKLNELFKIHEYGCTFTTKNGTAVRIPPRPAFFKAYERMMSKMERDSRETSKEVKRAMTQYVNEGKNNLFEKIAVRDLKGHKDYEKND